jgi:hypothetical protein
MASDPLVLLNSEDDRFAFAQERNILHGYRSYTYNFTLACLPQVAFKKAFDTDILAYWSEQYVIAKSSGKNLNAVSLPEDVQTTTLPGGLSKEQVTKLIEDYNIKSPGRFNFYFGNVEADNLISFNQQTGYSPSLNLNFEIIEPYSLGTFYNALHVTSVAAGHANFTQAPFVLKVEFKGYWAEPDTDLIPDPETVPYATRYFVFRFGNVKMSSSPDQGSKYSCRAIPINEYALGEPNKLPGSITVKGSTVKEAFDDFESQLNAMTVKAAKKTRGDSAEIVPVDTYKIMVPKVVEGIPQIDPYESADDKISTASTADLVRESVNSGFANPVENTKGKRNQAGTQKKMTMTFSAGANIHDCLAAIIRDSEWIKGIFKDWQTRKDDNGLIEYFTIGVRSILKEGWDDKRNKALYEYQFYAIPYKMHFTRIPGIGGSYTFSASELLPFVRRSYDYLYTGKNLDVLQFDINYNTLFFQAIPTDGGNSKSAPGGYDSAFVSPTIQVTEKNSVTVAEIQRSDDGIQPEVGQDNSKEAQSTNSAGENAKPQQSSDPYAAMVKNLHKAILDNVAAKAAEITIIGDPYYLVQNGQGNIQTKEDPTTKALLVDGSVDSQTADVYVKLAVQNANDYAVDDPEANSTGEPGLMQLNEFGAFSGLYRVVRVTSKFHEGAFTQILKMYQIPGQGKFSGQETAVADNSDVNPYATSFEEYAVDEYGQGLV